MSPFRLDWLLAGGWADARPARPVVEESAEEPGEAFRPSTAEWLSVAPRNAPKVTTPYEFTSADEAAEARVLADLADLITSRRLAPWEAADLLFNRTIEIGESDAYLA